MLEDRVVKDFTRKILPLRIVPSGGDSTRMYGGYGGYGEKSFFTPQPREKGFF